MNWVLAAVVARLRLVAGGAAAARWHLPAPAFARYCALMNAHGSVSVSTVAKLAAGVALLAAVTGLAFASWLDNGAAIFMTMVESGLSWCF
jgi:hypothetical protein